MSSFKARGALLHALRKIKSPSLGCKKGRRTKNLLGVRNLEEEEDEGLENTGKKNNKQLSNVNVSSG